MLNFWEWSLINKSIVTLTHLVVVQNWVELPFRWVWAHFNFKLIKKLSAVKNLIKNLNFQFNYLLQILKLHMVLFKLKMLQANNKLFFTEKQNHTNKYNTIKLPEILSTIN
jgi:hypothetical protein